MATITTELVTQEQIDTEVPYTILDERTKASQDIFFVECPPQETLAIINSKYRKLNLPWMYYVMTIGGGVSRMCSAYGRTRKSYGPRTPLYYMPLPNLYPRSRTFCGNRGVISQTDKYLRINEAITNFWGSNFSYIRPDTEPETWEKIKEVAGIEFSTRGYYDFDNIYAWWESLSPEEVIKLPWGRKKWGTIESVINSQYYAYSGFC
jgi:hypothetical protein